MIVGVLKETYPDERRVAVVPVGVGALKKAGFEVTDRIEASYEASESLGDAIREHAEWIRNETLAVELLKTGHPVGEIVMAFEIEEEELTVGIRRVSMVGHDD